MKTRRRIRGTIKWGGAALTVLLLIVWVGTRWYNATVWMLPTFAAYVYSGRVAIRWEQQWSIEPAAIAWNLPNTNYSDFMGHPRFAWWFQIDTFKSHTLLHIPIWFLALLTATATFLIWRQDRKRPPGTCPKCGYSRTGLPADRACPECGTAVLVLQPRPL